MRNWIEFPRTEGITSRQAHADLPEGSFEREIGRDGFFGPAAHIYHAHPPTGWTSFEGPLKPRAFNAVAAPAGPAAEPYKAALLVLAEVLFAGILLGLRGPQVHSP